MLYIFDWDGTLSDSTDKIIRCMHQACDQIELPRCTDAEVKNIIGLGLREALRKLYPGIDQTRADELKAAYSEIFIADTTHPPFFDGVLATLERLKTEGHTLTIATGKSRRGLDRILTDAGLSDFFEASRCADETASKPQPKMLEELLAEFAVQAEDAVMVGDTEYDMEMAQRINMPRIAVSYGAHHIERLRPYEPVLCLDTFPEILSL